MGEFLVLFGNITINQIIIVVCAFVFIYKTYNKVNNFLEHKKKVLIEQYESNKEKDRQLKEVLLEVNKYPEYREQSRRIQQDFQQQIDILNKSQTEICKSLKDLKEAMEKRERNKLQDRLLQSYKYYTDPQKNPNGTITSMESEAFWALFSDYEDIGGDGYIHSIVMPAMKMLKVIEKE